MVEIQNKAELDALIAETKNKVIIIDFSAEWCAPCRAMGELLAEMTAETDDFVVATVDIEVNNEIVEEYNIRSIPTLYFIYNGEIKQKTVGLITQRDIKEHISQAQN